MPGPTARLVMRVLFLVMGCWAVYRHGLTPEWTVRFSTGLEVGWHSWFWRAPECVDCTVVGIDWWSSMFHGGSALFMAIMGWQIFSSSPAPRVASAVDGQER